MDPRNPSPIRYWHLPDPVGEPHHPERPLWRFLLYSAGVVAAGLIGFFLFVVWFLGDDKITTIFRYERVLHKFSASMVDHFPPSIPKDRSRARLYYYHLGGIGQGDFWTAGLWLKLAPGEIDPLYERFDKIKSAIFLPQPPTPEGNYQWHSLSRLDDAETGEENLWLVPFSELLDPTAPRGKPSGKNLLLDFVVFTIPPSGRNGCRGVAINRNRSEIIYFANYVHAM